jgi:2-polyprenyl-6-methoxyphenol hydroxylase-like FAD-dependent oxidoreductase
MRLVWRADLYRVLQNLATEQGISVQYGKRIVSVVDGAGGITARFADGSTVSGDVLIGADGIHSTVRRLIDPNAPAPEYTGLLGFGGFADATGVSAEPREMYFVFGKRAFLGYWLAPDGRVMWFSNLPHEEALTMSQARAVPPGKWLRILRDVHRDETPGQRILEQATAGELHIVGKSEILATVPHWHLGRMVLTGDAAHAPSPSSGQGASLSIESAVELARCLRDLPDPQRAFRAYERLRRARVEKVAAQAASTNRNKAAGALGKLLMRVLMPLAFRTFMTPQSMFGWQYRYRIDWDAVVSDHA